MVISSHPSAPRPFAGGIERHVLHDTERLLIHRDVLVQRLEEVILGRRDTAALSRSKPGGGSRWSRHRLVVHSRPARRRAHGPGHDVQTSEKWVPCATTSSVAYDVTVTWAPAIFVAVTSTRWPSRTRMLETVSRSWYASSKYSRRDDALPIDDECAGKRIAVQGVRRDRSLCSAGRTA